MWLSLFRKRKEWLKWTLWLVIVGLSAGMVLLFVSPPTGVSGRVTSGNVAVVAGIPISAVEFRRHYGQLYDFYRQTYKLDEQDPEIIKQLGLGQQVLNQLIREYAIWLEAQEMGISVTPEEIAERITRLPAFQDNGKFMKERYHRVLEINNFTPHQFESGIRREVARLKLSNLLGDGMITTPEEVEQEFSKRNQKVKVCYVVFDPAALFPPEEKEADIREFFQKNKGNYKIDEQRKVKYVESNIDPDEVQISEEQILAHMDKLLEREQINARHILIEISPERDEEAARRVAEEVLERLRKGATFSQMARIYSEDTATADKGGELGFFGRGRMTPEFEKVAFSLAPGQISEPVQTPYGFHVIQLVKRQGRESLRPIAESQARQEEVKRRSRRLANKIFSGLESPDQTLEQVADQYHLSVTESAYFQLGDPLPGLSVRSDFNQQIFALGKGEVAEPYLTGTRYLVAQLTDITPARPAQLKEVRDRVLKDLKTRQGVERAEKSASGFSTAVREGSSFATVAKRYSAEVTTTDFFKHGENIDETLLFSPTIHAQILEMSKDDTSRPVKVAGKYAVFQVVDKSELDLDQLEKDKTLIYRELSQQKASRFFTPFVQNVLDKLRKASQIIINQEMVDQITG